MKSEAAEPITLYGDGEQTRDFTFVADAVAANLLALDAPVEPGTSVNIGGGAPVRLLDCLASMGEITGREVRLRQLNSFGACAKG